MRDRGYWAATVDDAVRASAPPPEAPKAIQTALASIATSVQSGKYVRTWIGTERADNGKTRVTLVWEPLPTGTRRATRPRRPRVAAGRQRQGRSRVPRPLARRRAGLDGAADRNAGRVAGDRPAAPGVRFAAREHRVAHVGRRGRRGRSARPGDPEDCDPGLHEPRERDQHAARAPRAQRAGVPGDGRPMPPRYRWPDASSREPTACSSGSTCTEGRRHPRCS